MHYHLGMRKIFNRLGFIQTATLSLLFAIVALSFPAQAQARQTHTSCSDDPIARGLWAGANFDLSMSDYCRSDDSDNDNSSDSQTNTKNNHSYTRSTNLSSSSRQNNQSSSDRSYYALGDSIAAGAGLSSQYTGGSSCSVSRQSYPSIIANELDIEYKNFACNGATAGDLLTEQHLSNTSQDIEPQLTTAFQHGTPRFITITAGANDLYWEDYLRYCYQRSCGGSAQDTVVSSLRSILRTKLEAVFTSIDKRSSGNNPTVIITGYYTPLSLKCATQQSGISEESVEWLNQQVELLNKAMEQSASEYDFVRYVVVDFSGHELCTSDSWIQDLDDSAPFHPTAKGQQRIAQTITSYMR